MALQMINYPDINVPMTKAYLDDLTTAFSTFPALTGSDIDRLPTPADPLEAAYKDTPPKKLATMVNMIIESTKSWHFEICPLTYSNTLEFSVTQTFRCETLLDPAPEMSAPKISEHSTETMAFKMQRYNKGIKMLHDFYKTRAGVEVLKMEMQGLASDIILTAKLAVISALRTCKNAYTDRYVDFPNSKPSFEEQFFAEVSSFGILSTQEKALYRLNYEAKSIMGRSNPRKDPSLAIFAAGDLSCVAFSSYETEAGRRGTDEKGKDIANQRLVHGVRSIDLGGIRICEDGPYTIPSADMNAKNMFERETQIGRSFTVSCNSYLNFPGERSTDYMDFKYYNVKDDDFVRFGVYKLLDNCGRFDADGSLSVHHSALCSQIDAFCATSGLAPLEGPEGTRLVDPYIFQCGKTGKHQPCVSVGDMEDHFLHKKFTQFFGDSFACRAKDLLREEGVTNLDSLIELANTLYNAPLDEKTENYKAGILLMPENHYPNASTSNWIGKGYTGAPTIPFRDPATSFLYMSDITAGDASVPLIAMRNTKTMKIEQYMFFKMPFEEGQWTPAFPDATSTKATKKTVMTGGKLKEIVIDDTLYAYERCPSYDKPYGYCDYTSLSYLAQVQSTGTTRGWSPEILQRAQAGISAFSAVSAYAQKVFLSTMSFDPSNVPAHLYTGTDSVDSVSAFFHNDFLRGEHQGVVGAEPEDSEDNICAIKLHPRASTADRTKLASEGVEILKSMGDPGTDRTKAMFAAILVGNLRPSERSRVLTEKGDYFKAFDESPVSLGMSKVYKADRHFRTFFNKFLYGWYKEEVTSGVRGVSDYKPMVMSENLWAGIIDACRNGSIDATRLSTAEDVEKVVSQLRGNGGDLPYTAASPAAKKTPSGEMTLKKMIYESLPDGKLKTALQNELGAVYGPADKTVLNRSMRLSFNPVVYKRLVDAADGVDNAFRLVAWPSNPLNPLAPITDWLVDYSDADAKSRVERSFPLAGAKETKDRHSDSIKYAKSKLSNRKRGRRFGDEDDGGGDAGVGESPVFSSSKRPRARGLYDPASDRVRMTGINFNQDRQSGDPTGPRFSVDRLKSRGDLTMGSVYDSNQQDWFAAREPDASSRNETRRNLINKLAACMQAPWSTLRRLGAMLMLQTDISKQQYCCWLDEGMPLPESYSYAEPFVSLKMSSAVWLDTRNAGVTAYNNQDMALQFNATNKTWIGHYSVWLASAIFQPASVYIKNDVAFKGVVRGLDGSVCADRLDFNYSQPRESRHTGFVFSHGPGLCVEEMPSPFWTLSGQLDEKLYPSGGKEKPNLRWPGDIYYNFMWRFYEMNSNSIIDRESWLSFINSNHVNEVMCQSRQKNWDPISKNFGTGEYVIKGKGHLKNWEAPSVKDVLNGKEMASVTQ